MIGAKVRSWSVELYIRGTNSRPMNNELDVIRGNRDICVEIGLS